MKSGIRVYIPPTMRISLSIMLTVLCAIGAWDWVEREGIEIARSSFGSVYRFGDYDVYSPESGLWDEFGWVVRNQGSSIGALSDVAILANDLTGSGMPGKGYRPNWTGIRVSSWVESTALIVHRNWLYGLCVMATVPLLLELYGLMRGVRARRAGLCPQCGYDLIGIESGTCPECGVEVESCA